MGSFKVVCVDDEKDVLDVLSSNMKQLGFEAICFEDPQIAFRYIKENHKQIVLVISDYKMARMNGLELRKKLVPDYINIPYVLLSAFLSKEMAVEAMALGICKSINKPWTVNDFDDVIENHVNSRQQTLIDDIEMVEGFLEETKPFLDEIEGLILDLENEPGNDNHINTYFRILHTIKGTAACLGLSTIAAFTHEYEDFVTLLKDKKLPITKTSIDFLLKGYDQLKLMVEHIESTYTDEGLDDQAWAGMFDYNQKEIEKESSNNSVVQQDTAKVNSSKTANVEKMSVSLELLDNFMELSGEVTVLRNSLLKSMKVIEELLPGNADVDQMNDTLEGLYKVTSQLQNKITEMRQVPISSVFRPFKRVVRDVAKSSNKDVELVLGGEELRVDTQIAKLLSNTLIHLIRNSVDHGIETKEDRKNKGKDEQGTVSLIANDMGEYISVTIKDDGNGINKEIVKSKAIEKNLYTQRELSTMSDSRIFDIIFESGFSTAQVVSDISGRGVGMDMVKSSILNSGGKIVIDSEEGQGSTFHLHIPYPKSVLIINSLLIEVSNQQFVISLDEVAEVVKLDNDEMDKIKIINGQKIYDNGLELIPTITISSVLNMPSMIEDDESAKLAIIKVEGQKIGLFVDNILDLEEVVKRPLSNQLKSLKFYSGASLLGTGQVALILDGEGLADHINLNIVKEEADYAFEPTSNDHLKEFILFESASRDSLGLPLDDIKRFEVFPSQIVEYTGNQALINYRGIPLPILHVESLLDFSSSSVKEYINSKEKLNVVVTHYQDKEYGILVEKINDIATSSEKIFTNTIDRKGLLGTIFINERNISLISQPELIELQDEKKNIKSQTVSMNINKFAA